MTGLEAGDDGLEIDLRPAGAAETPRATTAPEGAPVGTPSGAPTVIIDESVRQWMEEYARGDTTRERGGMLLGRLSGSGEEARVTIEAAVEAVGAEERRASITFTHETWAHINAVREERYPELRIVGWFHTHPGYGVFLSGYDLFIHRNFFNLPWQLAYVIDPVGGEAGFFGWRGEDITRLPGYYARGLEAAAAAPVVVAPAPIVVTVPRRRRVAVWASVAAAAVIVVLAVVLVPHRRPPARPPSVASPVRAAPASAAPRVTPPPAETKAPPLAKPVSPAEEPPQLYVEMRRGDTLWELSRQHLGDPRRYGELQHLNRILDPKRIAQGTIIAVPAAKTSTPRPQQKGEDSHGQGERDGDRRHGQQGAAGDAAR